MSLDVLISLYSLCNVSAFFLPPFSLFILVAVAFEAKAILNEKSPFYLISKATFRLYCGDIKTSNLTNSFSKSTFSLLALV